MPDDLTGRVWLRSVEEESGPIRVYRPEGYAFPPARGREGLVFGPDGHFDYLAPGRTDRPEAVPGSWRREPERPDRISATASGQPIELRVEDVTGERLRLEWLGP